MYRGQVTAGRQTHPDDSSAVLKRRCRKPCAAELFSRACFKLEMACDLAGAPIENIDARATSDPKSAVGRGQRRDNALFGNRGIGVLPRRNKSFLT